MIAAALPIALGLSISAAQADKIRIALERRVSYYAAKR